MKLKNGDEIEVGEERYRVVADELFLINEGSPPLLELTTVPRDDIPVRLDSGLIDFYLKKGYDVCPNCGGERNSEGWTGCGQYHYGTYCLS